MFGKRLLVGAVTLIRISQRNPALEDQRW